MPEHLSHLKHANQQLSILNKVMPDLALSLDHQLLATFPHRHADSCIDDLFITYQAPPAPGQTSELISYSLSALIEHSYLRGHAPTYNQSSTNVYEEAYTLDEQDLAQGISIVQIEAFVDYVINNLELCVKNALAHFWQTPHTALKDLKPEDWLSAFVRTLITAEAEQRHADKTLSDEGYAAVMQVLTFTAPPSNPEYETTHPLNVYNVALISAASDVELRGLLVIASSTAEPSPTHDPARAARNVVAYIPGSGLEEFDSLHALSQELQARLQDTYQREALLDCTLLKDRHRALTLNEIGYRKADANLFAAYAAQLIDKQSQDMAHTWKATRAQSAPYAFEALASLVQTSLNVSIRLDPAGIVKNRYTRLLESQLPVWLTSATEPSKQQWRQAVEHLKEERLLSQLAASDAVLEKGQKSTLLGYARAQLKKKIREDHQLDIDPDRITVTTSEALVTSPGVYPLSTSGYAAGVSVSRTGPTITYRTTRRSLSELALENIGLLDINFALTARVLGADGKHHPILTTSYLKALIRTLDIGARYQTLLHMTLANPISAQVKWRKERYTAVMAAQLRLDLLEAKLAAHITSEEAAWVDTLLSHPTENTRPVYHGSTLKACLPILRKNPVQGLLVITSSTSSRILCYTPNAPDKVWFRRANSLNELAIELSRKPLQNYVLQRVSSASQPYIKHSLKQNLSTSTLALQVITRDFLKASYDEDAAFAIRNADEQSTSTFEANVQTAKNVALTVIDVISFVLPTKILLPLTLARFIYSLSEGFDALQRDERNEAFVHFMDSISHLTDGASDFAGSAVFGSAIRQRVQTPAPALNPKAATTTPIATLRLRKSDAYGSGIYEHTPPDGGQARYYLQDEHGNLFQSHYDGLSETWRIMDARQQDALYTLPVSQLSEGRWRRRAALPSSTLNVGELIEKATVNLDLRTQTPDRYGVYTVNSRHYIQQSGHVFEVRYGWLGRHLYLQLPGSSSGSQNTYKVRRNAELGDWHVKHQQSDNTKLWEPLALNPSHQTSIPSDLPTPPFSQYDADPQYVSELRWMTLNKETDFQHYIYTRNTPQEAARSHINNIQTKMLVDAQAFFKTSPSRPHTNLPAIPAQASQEDIFKQLYEQYSGIVIGEAHSHTSSKKIIFDNMAFLAKNDVKVLYMEHLQTDLHQPYLDAFFKTGQMHPDLAEFLRLQDLGHQVSTSSRYTFTYLVQEGQRHGIHIKALDCVATYNIKGLWNSESKSVRHEMMNYAAAQIIRQHTPQTSNQKWIALTGNSHANTFKGVAGLAELEGAVGLRVQDVAPGTGQGIRPDAGYIDTKAFPAYVDSVLKNDLVLDIEIPGRVTSAHSLTHTQLAEKLPKSGMYTFDNSPQSGPLLVHRSHSEELIKTPFFFDADGRFYIDRPNWPHLHLKRYENLHHLLDDLKKMGLKNAP